MHVCAITASNAQNTGACFSFTSSDVAAARVEILGDLCVRNFFFFLRLGCNLKPKSREKGEKLREKTVREKEK